MKRIILLLLATITIGFISAQTHQLWGMTEFGGVDAKGTIFKTDENGNNHTIKHSFLLSPDEGQRPTSNLIQASNGKIYGMTPNNFGAGFLFEYDPNTSTYTMKYSFTSDPSGGTTPLGSLMEASNGKLYGTTSDGGANSVGTLFEYGIAENSHTKKVDFENSLTGGTPSSSLVQDNNGKLYGTSKYGGVNGDGVIFEYDIDQDALAIKFDFNSSASGSSPLEGLILANNGKLYGLTLSGGASNDGVLYEYDPATNIFTNKVDFHGFTKGESPQGKLIEASNGKLYGLAQDGGGNGGEGVLFEYDIETEGYVKKVIFDGASKGESPYSSLVESNNGKLYGVTYYGGLNDMGVLFEYEPSTNIYTKRLDFDETTGSFPKGSLIDVIVEGTASINEKNLLHKIDIYPNPAQGQLNLVSEKEIVSIAVYNLIGEQVFNHEINSTETRINLEHLPRGMFVINIIFDEGFVTKKVILD